MTGAAGQRRFAAFGDALPMVLLAAALFGVVFLLAAGVSKAGSGNAGAGRCSSAISLSSQSRTSTAGLRKGRLLLATR